MRRRSSLVSPYRGSPEIISIDRPRLLDELREVAARLVQDDPNVLQIILYGSVAKGRYTPESDIDILIVVRESNSKFLERRDAFFPHFLHLPMDVDIKVYTFGEVKKMLENGNPFMKEVMETGMSISL